MTRCARRRGAPGCAAGCLLVLEALLLTACASTAAPTASTTPRAPGTSRSPTAATSRPAPGPVTHTAARITYSTGTKLPSGFPGSVPIPIGSTVITSTASRQAGGGWLLTLTLKGPASTAVQSYRRQLAAAGFAVTGPTVSGPPQTIGISGKSSRWLVNVNVAATTTGSGQALLAGSVEMSLVVEPVSALSTPSGG